MTAFEEFGVLPEIGKAVDDMGWTLPTDVQVIRIFHNFEIFLICQRSAKKSSTCESLQYLLHIVKLQFQSEAIPLILGGGDVLMAAETGSGKTGAFCLPVLQIVWESLKDLQEGKANKQVCC